MRGSMTRESAIKKCSVGMRPAWSAVACVFATALTLSPTADAANVESAPPLAAHHRIDATLDVDAGSISVTDRIQIHPALVKPNGTSIELRLHAGLVPKIEGATMKVIRGIPDKAFHPSDIAGVRVPLNRLRIELPPGSDQFTLRYAGSIVHKTEQVAQEHQRSFQQTPGLISAEGVYLARSSHWVPDFNGELVSFELRVGGLPKGWTAVSEGTRLTSGEDEAGKPFVEWGTTSPVDDIHLVAGPWTISERNISGVDVRTYLRTDDAALAERYLEVTGQYLKMYEELIGAYPWASFSLVENFWETGYGMPGFTLLGPRVIRFPFILHSSYPHELLHNWWGNGVYLPLTGNNWAEGLTAYLADHLVAEQRRQGAQYRRTILSKYQSFVTPKSDFPLRQFSGRNSPASEAVGYGKWMMVLHMLRRSLGDDVFTQVLRTFYGRYQFSRATFADFQTVAERVSHRDLGPFFQRWVSEKGQPTLRWSDAQVRRVGTGASAKHHLRLTLEQDGRPFPMTVPIFVRLVDGTVESFDVQMREKTATLSATFSSPVARIEIDPRYEVFRRLLDGEVPPTLARALGAERMTLVTPSFGSKIENAAWKEFAAKICSEKGGQKECRVVVDKDLQALPASGAVWVLGYGNRLRGAAQGVSTYGAAIDDTHFTVGGSKVENGRHAIVLAVDQPAGGPDDALVFVGAANVASIAGLARKVPHYGKYSYLAFEGEEPQNNLKGTWRNDGSPMTIVVDKGATDLGRIPPSAPLRKLPPPFDADPLLATVAELASEKYEGRGAGTPGLKAASAYVVERFSAMGLSPGTGANKKFEISFNLDKSPVGRIAVTTLSGRIEGKDPSLAPLLVTAHLDHLGKGTFGAKPAHRGKVHLGANDNASGVAVLLAVAQAMKNAGPALRPVEFVIFTAEEAGLLDSSAYVAAMLKRKGGQRPMAVLNLDAVGRQQTDGFTIFGGSSATEWVHIFMGIGFTTGVGATLSNQEVMASDHKPFLDAGIPAVHIFGAPAPQIHTPFDTVDEIDPRALVDAAVLTREAAAYLANRKEPLTARGAKPSTKEAEGSPMQRRATLGTVPDYRFGGPGVRIHAVTSNSPAAKAGLAAGDIIVSIDQRPLRTLRQMTYALARRQPGDQVKLKIRRGDQVFETTATLVRR